MATSDMILPTDRRMRARLDTVFAALGQGFAACLESRARIGEINRLNAMSDAELARLGIGRDRIPHYVFRDRFHR